MSVKHKPGCGPDDPKDLYFEEVLRVIFNKLDDNNSGEIEDGELEKTVKRAYPSVKDSYNFSRNEMGNADDDRSHGLKFEEFFKFIITFKKGTTETKEEAIENLLGMLEEREKPKRPDEPKPAGPVTPKPSPGPVLPTGDFELELTMRGANLAKKDAGYQGLNSDPFLEIFKGSDNTGTKLCENSADFQTNTISPNWPKPLKFTVSADTKLHIVVKDYDSTMGVVSYDTIGIANVMVSDLITKAIGTTENPIQLQDYKTDRTDQPADRVGNPVWPGQLFVVKVKPEVTIPPPAQVTKEEVTKEEKPERTKEKKPEVTKEEKPDGGGGGGGGAVTEEEPQKPVPKPSAQAGSKRSENGTKNGDKINIDLATFISIFADEETQRFEKEEQKSGFEILTRFYTEDVFIMLSERLQGIFQNLDIAETTGGEKDNSKSRRNRVVAKFAKKSGDHSLNLVEFKRGMNWVHPTTASLDELFVAAGGEEDGIRDDEFQYLVVNLAAFASQDAMSNKLVEILASLEACSR